MRRAALALFAFLGLLWAGEAQAVCKLPYVLNNGTVTDAVKVMADLNALANCSGGGGIGSCSPTVPGSVPATGGGTINFLRADCTFAEPPGQPVTLIDCSGDHHALQSTVSDFICVTDVAQFDKNQTWTANQAMPPSTLTPGATITWDGLLNNYFEVTLDANNETLAAGTNVRAGNYTWFVKTGAGFTGFSTNAAFNFFGGTPTWSTTAGKEDVISCLVDSALRMNCFAGLDSGGAGGGVALTNAHIFVGNSSNIATDVACSGDVTCANTGAITIANAAVTNAKLLNAATTVNGQTCTLGSTCTITASATGITVGTTTITGGTTTRVLYDNSGVLGELTTSGSGTALALAASPSISALTVTGSFTATGLVTVADLVSSATTVNGRTCTLGSTCTLVNNDIGATTLATGTSVSLSAPREYYVCTSTCTVTPPVPAAGYEFCVMNDDNVSTAITLAALGSSARYENTARTAYGTAGSGTLSATAVVGNKVCILGLDSTHYLTTTFTGTWTAS